MGWGLLAVLVSALRRLTQCASPKVSDEDEILPPKLQAALVQILEDRDEVLAQEQQFSQGVRAALGVGGEGGAHTADPAPAHCQRSSRQRVSTLTPFLTDPQSARFCHRSCKVTFVDCSLPIGLSL